MKNDYANGAGLGQNTAALKSAPAFMSSRQITSPSHQQGSATLRTYSRNQKYSTPTRNNYLYLPSVKDSSARAATRISPESRTSSFSSQPQAQQPISNFSRPNFVDAGNSTKRRIGHRVNKRLPFNGLAVLVFMIALLALSSLAFKSGGHAPFSKQLASTVNIKLYYPAVLPSGYHVVNSSIKMTTSESMHFEITKGKNVIQIDESQAESGPDIARVLQTNFQRTSPISTSYGNAVVGYQKNAQGIFGSLVSKDGSWIIATSSSGSTDLGAITAIMSSMKPV